MTKKNHRNTIEGIRRCVDCKTDKPYAEFIANRRDPKGIGYQCKPCMAERGNTYYHANKETQRAYKNGKINEYRIRNVAVVIEALNSLLCVKCGTAKPLAFRMDGTYSKYHDPVMSLAKRPGTLKDVQELITKATPLCLGCSNA